jgi:hypothetical protein
MAAANYQDDDFSDPGYGGSMFAPLFLSPPTRLQILPSYPNNLRSDTTTIDSAALNYPFEYGRRYHAYMAEKRSL